MGPGGFAQTGGRTAPTPPGTTPFAFAPEATAYNETTDSLKFYSNGAPKRITYVGNVTPGSTEAYYYGLVKAELIAIGFNV